MEWKWGELRMVDPRLIVVDHAYQRPRKDTVISAIAASPDPRAFGVPVCFERENGVIYCADGQQRIAGVLASVSPPRLVPVYVLPSVKRADEAHIFWLINVYRKGLTPVEKHEGAREAGHPAANAIERVVSDLGLSIGGSHSPRSIGSIPALNYAYELGGELVLKDTIVAVTHAWPDDRRGFETTLLRVIADIVDAAHKNGGYRREKLVAALGKTTPAAIGRKAEDIRYQQGTGRKESVRRAIKALCRV